MAGRRQGYGKSFFIAGANSAVASNRNPTNEWIDIPIQAYLVEHEDALCLCIVIWNLI